MSKCHIVGNLVPGLKYFAPSKLSKRNEDTSFAIVFSEMAVCLSDNGYIAAIICFNLTDGHICLVLQ